jgi:hypothetical protein
MSWKPETESLDDHQLIDGNFMKASTVRNLADADCDVVIGKNTGMCVEKREKEEEYYEESDRSIGEMCTTYGEIFYEMKRFIRDTGMLFLYERTEWDTMRDFFIYMDHCYGE